MSHVPGRIPIRIPIRFHREAHEALAEAIGLCERADRLRADVSRIVADSLAADGQRDISDQAGTVEQLVDLVSEAAGLLGQATWFWAQTVSHEATSDQAARFPECQGWSTTAS